MALFVILIETNNIKSRKKLLQQYGVCATHEAPVYAAQSNKRNIEYINNQLRPRRCRRCLRLIACKNIETMSNETET